MTKPCEKVAAEVPAPQFDDVLKRMLSSPPKQHKDEDRYPVRMRTRWDRNTLESLDDMWLRLQRIVKGEPAVQSGGQDLVARAREEFIAGMDDDLNVSRALPGLFALRSSLLEGKLSRAAAAAALDFVKEANSVLGVLDTAEHDVDSAIQARIDEREAARKRRDFKRSDQIRDGLLAEGIVLEDTPRGVVWRRRG